MKDEKHSVNISEYAVLDRELSPFVHQTSYRACSGGGCIESLVLYPGVQLWTFDFNVRALQFPALEESGSIMLNSCFSGRYEMQLPDGRYVYADSELLCIDKTPPFGRTIIPIGEYTGIEISFNLDVMERAMPSSWMDLKISLDPLKTALAKTNGSYLALATPEYNRIIRMLGKHIKLADWSMEHYRYYMLCLLWTLQHERQNHTPFLPVFLTAGQRAVMMRIEELLTRDLGRRRVIADVAGEEGISPATLKKHFALVYGRPVSVYLKELRVKKAKELLAQSRWSIEEISSAVGYENQSKFAGMFRKETAVSPMEYRRLHQGDIKG